MIQPIIEDEVDQSVLITKLLKMVERQEFEIEALKASLNLKKEGFDTSKSTLTKNKQTPSTRRSMLKKFALGTLGAATVGIATSVNMPGYAAAAGGIYSTSSDFNAIEGQSAATDYNGVKGLNSASSGGRGVYGVSSTGSNVSGVGVQGDSSDGVGVVGISSTNDGARGYTYGVNKGGVWGINLGTTKGYGVVGSSNSSAGAGVYGGEYGNSGSTGVLGLSSAGIGVNGASDNNHGVLGTTNNSNFYGLRGINNATAGGIGIRGTGNYVGIWADSGPGIGGYFTGGQANIRLNPSATTGAPSTGSHGRGELYVDYSGALYYCKADGTPGIWVLLSNPGGNGGSGTSGPTLAMLPTPIRIVDTFNGTSLNNATGSLNGFGSISNGNTSSVGSNSRSYAGRGGSSGIPSNATTITGYIYCNTQSKTFSVKPGYGYLTLWKQGTAYPLASQTQGIVSLYYTHGIACGAAFTVGLSEAGQFSVASDSTTDISIDVTGYYL